MMLIMAYISRPRLKLPLSLCGSVSVTLCGSVSVSLCGSVLMLLGYTITFKTIDVWSGLIQPGNACQDYLVSHIDTAWECMSEPPCITHRYILGMHVRTILYHTSIQPGNACQNQLASHIDTACECMSEPSCITHRYISRIVLLYAFYEDTFDLKVVIVSEGYKIKMVYWLGLGWK